MDFSAFEEAATGNMGSYPFSLAASPQMKEVSLDFVENQEDMDRLVSLATIIKARVPLLFESIGRLSDAIDSDNNRMKLTCDAFAKVSEAKMADITKEEVLVLDEIRGRYVNNFHKRISEDELKRDDMCKELALLNSISSSFVDTEKKSSLGECYACMNNPVTIAYVPCGHTMCVDCSNKLETSFCAVCRTRQEKRIRIYTNGA